MQEFGWEEITYLFSLISNLAFLFNYEYGNIYDHTQ